MLTPDEIRKIMEYAAKATPGPWDSDDDNDGEPCVFATDIRYGDDFDDGTTAVVCKNNGCYDMPKSEKIANSEYIAACNPTTVSKLCEMALLAVNLKMEYERLSEKLYHITGSYE